MISFGAEGQRKHDYIPCADREGIESTAELSALVCERIAKVTFRKMKTESLEADAARAVPVTQLRETPQSSRDDEPTELLAAARNKGYKKGREQGYLKGHKRGLEEGLNQGRDEGAALGIKIGRTKGHKRGYVKGHKEGLEEGLDQGRDEGANTGYVEGFDVGKMIGEHMGREELREEMSNVEEQARAARSSLRAEVKAVTRLAMAPLPSVHGHYDKYAEKEVMGPVKKFIVDAFISSRRSHRGQPPPRGTGKHFRAKPKIIVSRVIKLVNPRTAKAYIAGRDEVIGRPDCDSQKIPYAPGTARKHWSEVLGGALNERFLFHGTSTEDADAISRGGIDPRRSGKSLAGSCTPRYAPMFGHAIYLADDSSKSDIYAKPNEEGECCVLLVRTVLGEPYFALRENRTLLGPPLKCDCVVGLRDDEGVPIGCKGDDDDEEETDDEDEDCTTGQLGHREYVVYNKAQTYPEYQIWYSHAESCQCSKCVL